VGASGVANQQDLPNGGHSRLPTGGQAVGVPIASADGSGRDKRHFDRARALADPRVCGRAFPDIVLAESVRRAKMRPFSGVGCGERHGFGAPVARRPPPVVTKTVA
jgi:hypothetical protein